MKKVIAIILLSSVFILYQLAFCGSFQIFPVKVLIDAKKKIEKLTIRNLSEEDLTVQLAAFVWMQDKAGNDNYEPAKDLVITPKILTLKKGEEKIIRVGYMGHGASKELSYRLFVEELPVKKEDASEIKILLRLNMPIFIRPLKVMHTAVIEDMQFQERKFSIMLRNTGNAHIMINTVRVVGYDGDDKEIFQQEQKGWYLLNGASRVYTFELPSEICAQLKELFLSTATPEKLDLSKQITVTESDCSK